MGKKRFTFYTCLRAWVRKIAFNPLSANLQNGQTQLKQFVGKSR